MTPMIMILLPAVLMFVWMMTMQRRMLARAADVLAGMRDPEEKVEYLPFKSAWPSAKKRVMDSRINEVEQEGWTFLKATSAPFKETIRSWGGGLELHFVRERQSEEKQEPTSGCT